ncbi:hypothetical protein L210DRAFT_3534223 [Boletus edulis BED1]|uniref:Uncharacterized protein n=1 Tax=Boletus edulis BED1 TaxID=1328754 RepID=A0AAD4BXM7_BOLED|nr:hypothetical protein L210DRAFT_3534223 [Boletus edulis BED1]
MNQSNPVRMVDGEEVRTHGRDLRSEKPYYKAYCRAEHRNECQSCSKAMSICSTVSSYSSMGPSSQNNSTRVVVVAFHGKDSLNLKTSCNL